MVFRSGILFLCAALLFLPACSSMYYGAMEKVGVHKRDILADRVEAARDSQQETKEQFASALERFRSVMNFDGGELEDKYDELNAVLERSEAQAEEVSERIAAVEDVAEALFDEWDGELDQYTSKSLREQSRNKLKQTRSRYAKLIGAMKKAEGRIAPVLNPLRDQVLFLKHNLNARAISSLKNELGGIETDVTRLVREMELSIKEADSFIRMLQQE
ncbi:MAG: DUF2959 domain-containing protein [Desulfuromonas sp.]|nr:MAG: DUF2959 domain-containing protein [Desulfuromonas sp.]